MRFPERDLTLGEGAVNIINMTTNDLEKSHKLHFKNSGGV